MVEDPDGPLTQPLERKLATILAADVAEYSRLMAEDEEQTLRTFRRHKRVFESLVTAHRGRIFNTAGDAILAEFPSAVEAMRCATEIQAALHTTNEQLPPARRVRFRIGVNLGDVMVHGEDLLGDGVNVAARLQAEAEPGGICISGTIHDQIRNKLSLTFKPLGEKRLKNIPQPVRTFSVVTTETRGVLPSPRRFSPGRPARWLGAAALALLVVAGGYWAYSERQRSAAEHARLREEATRQETALREARLTAERLAAEQAQQRASAERQALETARREMQIATERAAADTERRKAAAAEAERRKAEADAERRKAEASKQVAAVPATPAGPAVPPASPPVAARNGVYAGPVCLGAAAGEPPRCYRAQATVDGSKISGQWSGARDGTTIFLRGEISPSGDAKIQMHGENVQGGRLARADLTGTLRDGRLDAAGSFRNGRAINLAWRKE